MSDHQPDIHSTVEIAPDARIGPDVKLRPYCAVLAGAEIGAGSTFGRNCIVGPGVRIGRRVKIQDNIVIVSGVEIEDEVFIGPGVVFTNVKTPRAFIDRTDEFLPTRLMQGCSIGGGAVIVCGATVGRFALIGAGTVIVRDVPDHALAFGNPARQRGWVGRSGLTLRFGADGWAVDPWDGRCYNLCAGGLVKP